MIDFIRVQDALENIAEFIATKYPNDGYNKEFYKVAMASHYLRKATIQWWTKRDDCVPVHENAEEGLKTLDTAKELHHDYWRQGERFIGLPMPIVFSTLGFDQSELIQYLDKYEIPHSLVKSIPTIIAEPVISNQATSNSEPHSTNIKLAKTPAAKAPKKLKPFQRDGCLSLTLIREMFERYRIEYSNKLTPAEAWSKIISGDFNSELFELIVDSKKSIKLSDGNILKKEDFMDKYRRQFE